VADPQAPVANDKEGVFRPFSNAQVCYDLESPLILSWEVFPQASDRGLGPVMVHRHRRQTGVALETLLVDHDYVSVWELEQYQQAGVQVYGSEGADGPESPPGKTPRQIPKSAFTWDVQEQHYTCPEGQRLTWRHDERRVHAERETTLQVFRAPAAACQICRRRAECTTDRKGRTVKRLAKEHLLEALRARMQTAEAQVLYRLRRQTVERCYADFKAHRALRRFTCRGLEAVRGEWGLLVLAHNGLCLVAHLRGLAAGAAAGSGAQPGHKYYLTNIL
jgi:hypothetical protein